MIKANDFDKMYLQTPAFEQVRGGVLAIIQREKFVVLNKQNNGDVSATDQVNNQLSTIYIPKVRCVLFNVCFVY